MSVFSPKTGTQRTVREGSETLSKTANKYAGDGIKSWRKGCREGEREFLWMNKTEVSPPTPPLT